MATLGEIGYLQSQPPLHRGLYSDFAKSSLLYLISLVSTPSSSGPVFGPQTVTEGEPPFPAGEKGLGVGLMPHRKGGMRGYTFPFPHQRSPCENHRKPPKKRAGGHSSVTGLRESTTGGVCRGGQARMPTRMKGWESRCLYLTRFFLSRQDPLARVTVPQLVKKVYNEGSSRRR